MQYKRELLRTNLKRRRKILGQPRSIQKPLLICSQTLLVVFSRLGPQVGGGKPVEKESEKLEQSALAYFGEENRNGVSPRVETPGSDRIRKRHEKVKAEWGQK